MHSISLLNSNYHYEENKTEHAVHSYGAGVKAEFTAMLRMLSNAKSTEKCWQCLNAEQCLGVQCNAKQC